MVRSSPPLLEIANLNLQHYTLQAQLLHCLQVAAQPVLPQVPQVVVLKPAHPREDVRLRAGHQAVPAASLADSREPRAATASLAVVAARSAASVPPAG
jgi:hypothetical protein